MTNLERFTDQLVTLFNQECVSDGEVDPDLLARVQSTQLTEDEWWDVMTNHWPHDFNLEELSMALSWLQDSPIWLTNVPTRVPRRRRKG
jgi:hypothetical protein